MSFDCDVIVVGGGPAGSAASTWLARSGHRVVLFERERFPRFHIGESLLASTNDVLDAIGANDLVRQAGFPKKWGATFMTGMMATDGINGLWIARLIRRSDQLACYASRAMSLTVALLSLLVAGFGVARYFSPGVAAWGEGRETILGLSVVAVVASSFLLARLLARRAPAVSDSHH